MAKAIIAPQEGDAALIYDSDGEEAEGTVVNLEDAAYNAQEEEWQLSIRTKDGEVYPDVAAQWDDVNKTWKEM